MTWKDFYTSRKVKCALAAVGVLALMLLMFQIGVVAGVRRAEFSGRLGDNYSRIFEGRRPEDAPGFPQNLVLPDVPGGHGATGKVVSVSGPTIVVASPDNTEKIVEVSPDTIVRLSRETASTTDIRVGDSVIVIGEPDSQGQIDAAFVRIVPEATSTNPAQ